MSEYPHNTATALAALYPDAPPDSWQVFALSNGNTELSDWRLPGEPPTPTEVSEYLGSQAFADLQLAQARESMIVSRLQARLALIQAGLWASVELWAQDPETPPEHLAFFEDASNWQRNDSTLAAAATALGLTDEQMDGLFALAATL